MLLRSYSSLCVFVAAARGGEVLRCSHDACREHTPETPDPDCCGMRGHTFCAPGFEHSKFLSVAVGGKFKPPRGYFYECPSAYGGNTCCTPIGGTLQVGNGSAADDGRDDYPVDAIPIAEGLAGVGTCPVATLDALNRGRQSDLCREDYCDPEIVYKVCKDWTPCKASLVAAYGEEAGLKFDDACFKGVGVFIALAVVLPICFICLGVLIGKCCLQRRSRRRGAEERVAFTTAEGGVGGLTLGQLQPAQTAPHYDAEAVDPLARIETLKRLLDAGAIGEGEYHGMKAEMLSRI